MIRCISVDSAFPGEDGKTQNHSTIRENNMELDHRVCVGVQQGVDGAASAH